MIYKFCYLQSLKRNLAKTFLKLRGMVIVEIILYFCVNTKYYIHAHRNT